MKATPRKNITLFSPSTEYMNHSIAMKSTEISTNQISNLFSILSFDSYNQLVMGQKNLSFIEANSSDFLFNFALDNYFPYIETLSVSSQTTLKNSIGKILKFEFPETTFYNDSDILEKNSNQNINILQISFKIRACIIGEYFDFKELKCIPCQPGFYSFQRNFLDYSLCTSCALENFYCYGEFNLSPKKGFWRFTEESTNFIKCPSHKG